MFQISEHRNMLSKWDVMKNILDVYASHFAVPDLHCAADAWGAGMGGRRYQH